jgi:hypothetical protein
LEHILLEAKTTEQLVLKSDRPRLLASVDTDVDKVFKVLANSGNSISPIALTTRRCSLAS